MQEATALGCPSPAITIQATVLAKKDGNIKRCLWPHPSSVQRNARRGLSPRVRVYLRNVKKQVTWMFNCMPSNKLLLKVWIYGLVCFVFHWCQKDNNNRWHFILCVNGQLGAAQQKDTTDKRFAWSVLFFLLFRIVLQSLGQSLRPYGIKVYISLLQIFLLESGNCQAAKKKKR